VTAQILQLKPQGFWTLFII